MEACGLAKCKLNYNTLINSPLILRVIDVVTETRLSNFGLNTAEVLLVAVGSSVCTNSYAIRDSPETVNLSRDSAASKNTRVIGSPNHIK